MNKPSSSLLVVWLNATPVLEYDRRKNLSSIQKQSLFNMDENLGKGISLHEEFIVSPTLEQRIEFVSANLITAILNDEEALAAASCAYIAQALPELKQIKAFEKAGEISIELIFDRDYQPEEKLSFIPLERIHKYKTN